MKLRYLLDENISPKMKTALLRLSADMDVLRIGEADAPSLGTLLHWELLILMC